MSDTTKTINNLPSPSGEGQGGASPFGGRGALILTRKLSNRSFTIGELTAEGDDKIICYTLESYLPLENQKYMPRLLPPGIYPMTCKNTNIMVGLEPFRGEWASFDKVKFYPKAGFTNYVSDKLPVSGAIFIGAQMVDEFTLADPEHAVIAILNYCHGRAGEDMQLRIVENRDEIEFHDYTKHQFDADAEYEKEQQRINALRERIYSPPAPQGGV